MILGAEVMMNSIRFNGHHLAACAVVATLGVAAPAFADTPPDFTVTFPAGLTCPFELQVDGWIGNNNRADLTFKEDKNGYVRSISAGIGSALRYTNTSNQKTMSTKANGAVTHTLTYSLDGSQTVSSNGHNVLFLFPTDIPAGRATILYIGRVVYTVAPAAMGGYYTVQSYSGKAVDICAALQ
jgi:hypothetical protein